MCRPMGHVLCSQPCKGSTRKCLDSCMYSLKLSHRIQTSLPFEVLYQKLKSVVGERYKRGYMDKDWISLFYIDSHHYTVGMDKIPMCQIRIENNHKPDGPTEIEFRMAPYVIIMWIVIPLATAFGFAYFVASLGEMQILIPIFIAIIFVAYLFLVFYHSQQSERFLRDIEKFEMEHTKRLKTVD